MLYSTKEPSRFRPFGGTQANSSAKVLVWHQHWTPGWLGLGLRYRLIPIEIRPLFSGKLAIDDFD